MSQEQKIDKLLEKLQAGSSMPKCLGCRCLKDSLEMFSLLLSKLNLHDQPGVREKVTEWLDSIQTIDEMGLDCQSCPPAEAVDSMSRMLEEDH